MNTRNVPSLSKRFKALICNSFITSSGPGHELWNTVYFFYILIRGDGERKKC